MKKKKLLVVILSVMLIFAVLPIGSIHLSATATSGTTGKCTWSLDGTVLTISGNGNMDYSYSSSQPWGTNITQVIIENGVTSIGEFAFDSCYKLTSVIIPDSVEKIRYGAFFDCDSLTSISIPGSVTDIEEFAFASCDSLKTVHIREGAVTLYGQSFGECYNLKTVYLPKTLKKIYSYDEGMELSVFSDGFLDSPSTGGAFNLCKNLTDVYYAGTEDEKNDIYIQDGNYYLSKATWHYEYTFGDITFDGAINATDLIGLQKLLLSDFAYAENLSADINVDGMINILDLIRLKKHLSGIEVQMG